MAHLSSHKKKESALTYFFFLFSINDDTPVAPTSTHILFPHILGVLAFDTPYLGLSQSVLPHSAEGKLKTAANAYGKISAVASGMFLPAAAAASQQKRQNGTAAPTTHWSKWAKVAALSGAAAALAAGGAAAAGYIKKEDITASIGWVSSHLEFVGALYRTDELTARLTRIADTPGVGFANLFTSLGGDRLTTASVLCAAGMERTFCTLPPDGTPLRKKFFRCINVRADDEVGAHVSMFEAKTNPGYYELADRVRSLVALWVGEDSLTPFRDEDEFAAAAAAATSTRSSRRSSHDLGPGKLDRTDSSKSTRSGKEKRDKQDKEKHDREKKEKKERKERKEKSRDRERLERSMSGLTMDDGNTSSGASSTRPKLERAGSSSYIRELERKLEKEREREERGRRKSAAAGHHHGDY